MDSSRKWGGANTLKTLTTAPRHHWRAAWSPERKQDPCLRDQEGCSGTNWQPEGLAPTIRSPQAIIQIKAAQTIITGIIYLLVVKAGYYLPKGRQWKQQEAISWSLIYSELRTSTQRLGSYFWPYIFVLLLSFLWDVFLPQCPGQAWTSEPGAAPSSASWVQGHRFPSPVSFPAFYFPTLKWLS